MGFFSILPTFAADVISLAPLSAIGAGIAIAVMGLDADLFFVILVGLIAGRIIGTVTEGFTSTNCRQGSRRACLTSSECVR